MEQKKRSMDIFYIPKTVSMLVLEGSKISMDLFFLIVLKKKIHGYFLYTENDFFVAFGEKKISMDLFLFK